MEPELHNIIRHAYQHGQDLNSIKRSLLLAGWSESQIQSAINDLKIPAAPPIKVSKKSFKPAFVISLMVTGLLSLAIFRITNSLQPTVTNPKSAPTAPSPEPVDPLPTETQTNPAIVEPQTIKISTAGGNATLVIPPNPQFNTALAHIEVTAWVPLQSAFVSGIYHYTPERLTVSPPAQLTITYLDDSLKDIPEEKLLLYHQPTTQNFWRPLVAAHNLDSNSFTIEITDMGKYTLGFDDNPPGIRITNPTENQSISNPFAITGTIIDTGTGVKHHQILIDDQPLQATATLEANGNFLTREPLSLSAGTHTITISASDYQDNTATKSATFTVN